MKVDVTFVVDRSGSMFNASKDVEGSIATFLEEQSAVSGDIKFSLVEFNAEVNIVCSAVELEDFPKYVHKPRGGTALNDAVGIAVTEALSRQADRYIIVVQTDGHENSSRYWSQKALKTLISSLEATEKWEFVFVGADIDVQMAQDMGFSPTHTIRSRGVEGMTASFRSISKNVGDYRVGSKIDMSYTAEDRKDAGEDT